MRYKIAIIWTVMFLFCSCDMNNSEQKKLFNILLTQMERLTADEKPKQTKTLQFKKNEEYTVKVVRVADGDTFTGLTDDNRQVRCRLYGIDAPEGKQDYGKRSTETLAGMIAGKHVKIVIMDIDRYKRPVTKVYTLDGKDVCAEMLRTGMAWHYKQYSKDEDYAELENEARQKKIGLWAGKNPAPPWEFRKK